jgi:uncharacterized protein (DUF2235 family)
MGAYRWLSDTYHPGDKIFLFGKFLGPCVHSFVLNVMPGFSRGAYQVRALAGMIHEVSINFDLLSCLSFHYSSDR